MDMIEHIKLPRGSAELLFDAYISWFEDFDSGFEDGIYDNQPDEDDRIAYEFATGSRGDPDSETVRLPWHAAVAIEAGVSSYLEDLESGLEDGTYDEAAGDDVHEAAQLLTSKIKASETHRASHGAPATQDDSPANTIR